MKKRFALIPSEREKECEHEHMHFRGKIPCTGSKVCSMCGLTEDEIRAEERNAFVAAYVKARGGTEEFAGQVYDALG